MRTIISSLFVVSAALAVSGAAFGQDNTAYGEDALNRNAYGYDNTAVGFYTLYYNYDGSYNTATGYEALFYNVLGNNNTATGYYALYGTTTTAGNNNTATGYQALYSFNNGSNNTATGMDALYTNSDGNNNTATGANALYTNSTGLQNTATGKGALYANTTGNFNTASGTNALYANTTGSSNIAEGYEAGYRLTTGSNNIDIGSQGVPTDSGVIRIGTITGTTSTQSATYIAGIYNVTTMTSGLPVLIDSKGQLGTTSSSERFKTAIHPMGSNTAKLLQLRPVTFHYKADPEGTLRYGLIAEEVAKVYPELVVRDASGRIDGVRYDELAPMLLNEVQQQRMHMSEKIAMQAAEIRDLKAQMADLKDLRKELRAGLLTLATPHEVVAQR
jgi:hypothetical protein